LELQNLNLHALNGVAKLLKSIDVASIRRREAAHLGERRHDNVTSTGPQRQGDSPFGKLPVISKEMPAMIAAFKPYRIVELPPEGGDQNADRILSIKQIAAWRSASLATT